MKKALFLFVLIVFCRCTNDMPTAYIGEDNFTIISDNCFPVVNDKYIYPIVPGMIEWQELNSTEDAYRLCQLPDEVLKSISTQGLIDALIHAPLFTGFSVISSNASALKWHAHYQNFNSAIELYKRNDAGNALIAYYQLVCFDCFVDTSVETYREYERMLGLEILFTKQEILDSMTHEKKKEAVKALLTNYEQFDNWHSLIPLAHIMLADKYAPIEKYSNDYSDEFQCTLEGYNYPLNPNQWNIIVSYAKNFINN